MTAAGQSAKPGVFIMTFGCQMNEYDTQKLLKILEGRYQRVDNAECAELVLLNTCSVRDKPEQKVYSELGRLRELKEERPRLLVGVGGCVAQQEGRNLIERNRAIDFVFGTHNLSLVPSLIDLRLKGYPPQVAIDYRDEWEELPLGFPEGGQISVSVAISRGCNKRCSFCIVPVTRGKEVSRSVGEVLKEVRLAAHRGAREVLLLGQTVNSYGRDLTPRVSFESLLDDIAAVPGIERMRFTSPHPQEVRANFVNLLKNNKKVCRHVHMPLQSGSDVILKAMNRNYRRKRFLEIIEAIKGNASDISITTDLIVGFPGETDGDFQETMDVLEKVRFDSSYSFIYSPRPGTPAAALPDPVPFEEKLRRLQILQRRQDEITSERLLSWVGREVEVLVDGPSTFDSSLMQGRTSQNVVLNFEHASEFLIPGRLVGARVTGAGRYTLRGEPVGDQCQT